MSARVKCEHCGEENGHRQECEFCGRLVCRYCETPQGYFCVHGTVKTISINNIKESEIKAIKNYRRRL